MYLPVLAVVGECSRWLLARSFLQIVPALKLHQGMLLASLEKMHTVIKVTRPDKTNAFPDYSN